MSSCHWLFYLALLVATVGVVLGGSASVAISVSTAGAVAAWYGYWNLRAVGRLSRSRLALAMYLAGAGVGWLALMSVDRGYDLAGVVMFAQLFGYLRRRLALVVVIVVVGASVAFGGVAGTLGVGLQWRGVGWGDAVGAVVTMALVVLCVFLDREVAAARADLAAAERRAGVLSERARLAGDLHDTLTQNLSSMVMQLEVAREAYRVGDLRGAANLDQALATARSGLADVRGLVWDLRPESLGADTLDRAVARLADRLGDESGVAVRAVVTGERRDLPTRTEVALLRVAEEALANVRKHARASTVTVTLSYLDGVVALDVCDDGGLGLEGMRDRVEAAGGSLAVESAPGQGTSVAAQVPVERAS